VVVVLNKFDVGSELHQRNLSWLAERDDLRVLTTPGGESGLARVMRTAGSAP
jgi:hypothetical protein